MTLALSFFVTAIVYAAVGFGGGSTYSALLVVAEVDYRILPSIALMCNIVVVSGGAYRFSRAGHVDLKRIIPWLITSVPAAWFGGSLNISETLFIGLLGFSLLVAGLHMIFFKGTKTDILEPKAQSNLFAWVLGAVLGLLAGLVGIGGGIFLAPILYFLCWDHSKKIAVTCSVFILVNSISGLFGQIIKLGDTAFVNQITEYWMLFMAVFIGGQIGSFIGTQRLNTSALRFGTALLILYAAFRLLWRWLSAVG